MARPKKQTVDYYPHMAKGGKTIFILESRWGNDGYAFFHKLLEILCSTDGHIIDFSETAEREFLLAKTHVNEETATGILDKLSELGKIDQDLWSEGRIWYQNLVDNVKDAYKKRIDDLPQKPSLRNLKPVANEFPATEMLIETISGGGSTESKVKESKVKNIPPIYPPEFEEFWSSYPEGGYQNSKPQSLKNFTSLIKKGISSARIIQSAKNYAVDCITEGRSGYWFKTSNFLGKAEYYKAYLPENWVPMQPRQPSGQQGGQSRTAGATAGIRIFREMRAQNDGSNPGEDIHDGHPKLPGPNGGLGSGFGNGPVV